MKPNKFVTKAKFLEYQKVFYTEVINSPREVTISYIDVATPLVSITPHPLRAFLKSDAGRDFSKVTTKFKCLYEKVIDESTREKVGVTYGSSYKLYLSPIQIESAIATFKTHIQSFKDVRTKQNKLIISGFDDEPFLYYVTKVEFTENFYDTCIAIELQCREYTRG